MTAVWRRLASVLLVAAAACGGGPGAAPGGDVRVQRSGGAPRLIFGCDRQTPDLETLFSQDLVADLTDLHASIALSTEDFSAGRARVVRRLNAAGVPVIAWLALPRQQGYYVNASNAVQTTERFRQFDDWSRAQGLRWEAVGLDIEPTLAEYSALTSHPGALVSLAARRAFDSGRVARARGAYAALVRDIRGLGYRVQTYQLSFIADGRDAHTSLLERIFGIVDVRGDDEVLMLYTSLSRALGAATIWAYGPEAQVIAVGSTATAGDAAMDARYPPLTWDEFSRDLIVASHFSSIVGVYSLEGCVRRGFMPKLKAMDWSRAVVIPAAQVDKARQFRSGVRAILWLGSHLLSVAAVALLLAALLLRALFRWRRRRRARKAMRLQPA